MSSIDYPQLIDSAMRDVVRKVLKQVERSGLPGDHHFFISYNTNFPGVKISEALHARYPEEITIVIQHQYGDLKVTEDGFSITLSFSNVPEKLVVPFDAILAFADPSIKFGLQFHAGEDDEDDPPTPSATLGDESTTPKKPKAEKGDKGAEIITLDAFRKK